MHPPGFLDRRDVWIDDGRHGGEAGQTRDSPRMLSRHLAGTQDTYTQERNWGCGGRTTARVHRSSFSLRVGRNQLLRTIRTKFVRAAIGCVGTRGMNMSECKGDAALELSRGSNWDAPNSFPHL
jgi:hypothetical protein